MSHNLPPRPLPVPEEANESDTSNDLSYPTPKPIPPHIVDGFSPGLFRGLVEERWGPDPALDDPAPKSDNNTVPLHENTTEPTSVDSRFSPLSALDRQRMNVRGIIGGTVIRLAFKPRRGSTYKPWYRRLADNDKQD